MELVKRFEGGAAYKEERDGKFILVINQVGLLDMLNDEDREGIEAVKEIEFSSEESRREYIQRRGWL